MYRDSIVFLGLLSVFLTGDGQAQSQNLTRKLRQNQGCTLSGTDEYGTCQKWSECQSAQTAYKINKIAPIYCRYDGIDPIVCCSPTTQTAGSSNEHFVKTSQKRISEKKCIEAYTPEPTTTSTTTTAAPYDPEHTTQEVQHAIAGIRTEPQEFTHMAALGWKKDSYGYDYLCGGTLISTYFVLTAAHCTSYKGVAPEVVRIGGESLHDDSIDVDTRIAQIVVHPQYKRKQVYDDIALLKLEFANFHNPACLWQTNEINQKDVIAIGYGHTTFAGKGSDHLLKIFLNIFPKEQCQQHYHQSHRLNKGIVDSQICAADPKNTQDTCQGDSGGPLMKKVNGIDGTIVPIVIGVTSFGLGCAGGAPSIYVKVFSYLDWIESIVWPN